jgi:hypothetical protein
MTYLILSLVSAFLSGVSRGAHHARRDYPTMNKSRKWVSERLWIGGKENGFKQSSIRTADFAHRAILCQCLFWALSGVLLALAEMPWYVIVAWFPAVYHRFEPRGFDLLYNVILPDGPSVPQFSVWVWLRGWIY